jgi:type I site-specific restriction-modification system R (restriction) subunit
MYTHDRPNSHRLQDFVSVLSTDKEETNKMNMDAYPSNDPITNRVFELALKLLDGCDEITVKDIVQASNFSDSPVRKRIALLVDAGKLGIRLGSGREPSRYFLPNIKSADVELVKIGIDNSSDNLDDIPGNLVGIADDSDNHLNNLNEVDKAKITFESFDFLLDDMQDKENYLKKLIAQTEDEIRERQTMISQIGDELKRLDALKQSVTKTYEVFSDFLYGGEYDL